MNLLENTRKKQRTKEKQGTTDKGKKHVSIKPNVGYVAKVVRSFYFDLAGTRNVDPTFVRAVKLASHSYNDLVNM